MACGLEKSKTFELPKRAITQKIRKQRKVVFFNATFLLFLGMDEGRTGCFDSREMKVR